MKIAIFGAGGIGCAIGGHLARAEADVTLIARGAHLAAMQEKGLTLRTPAEEFTVHPAPVTDDVAATGPFDVILLTTKLYDLEDAARTALPALADEGFLVPLQNGVTAGETVAAIAGTERVVPGTTYVSCFVVEPGTAAQKSPKVPVIFGEAPGGASERTARLAQAGQDAGLAFNASDNIQIDLWRKFVALSGFSAVGCLSRQPMGGILADAELRALFLRAMQETVAVGQAAGVPLPDDAADQALAHAENYAPEARGSMQEDLLAGRRMEVAWQSGAVVRIGRLHGIDTPVHQTAAACLEPFADGG